MGERFRSKQRIRAREDFRFLYEHGRYVRGRLLNFWWHAEETSGAVAPKMGMAVSRKVSLSAPVRNRWKRLLREVFRRNQHNIKKNTAFVVQVRRNVSDISYAEVEREFLTLMKKTGNLE